MHFKLLDLPFEIENKSLHKFLAACAIRTSMGGGMFHSLGKEFHGSGKELHFNFNI